MSGTSVDDAAVSAPQAPEQPPAVALVVGLTGGIASGKSTVGELFIALGVPLLDGDHVAREVVAPPSPALAAIAAEFGSEYLQPDGTLDRRRLRERVFGDAGALHRLEAITHPLIRQRILDWRAAQTAPYCILSVAILLEAAMDRLVDRVLVVDVPVATQLQRLVTRDGIAEPLARQMIAAQATREIRLARADDVIVNDAPPQSLASQVQRLHRQYQAIAATR